MDLRDRRGGAGMGVTEVERPGAPVRGGRRTLDSVLWAVLLPGGMALGAGIGQYVLWLGVVITLGLTALAACLIGGVWHRAGAATLAALSCFALMLFAGPAMYEVYMKTAGDPVPAVVTQVVDEHHRHGADLFCTVTETGGDHTVHRVSQRQNCFGQAVVGDRVEIRKDPLGLLEPPVAGRPGPAEHHRAHGGHHRRTAAAHRGHHLLGGPAPPRGLTPPATPAQDASIPSSSSCTRSPIQRPRVW